MAYIGDKGVVKLNRSQQIPQFVPDDAFTNNRIFAPVDHNWVVCDRLTAIYTDGTIMKSVTGFAAVDELGKIQLHSTPEGALNNTLGTQLSITDKDAGTSLILTNEPSAGQLSVLSNFLNLNPTAPIAHNYTGINYKLSAIPSIFAAFLADPMPPVWELQGSLEKWTLDMSSPAIEVSRLGETFGRNTKSVVTGSGSFNFIFHYYTSPIFTPIAPALQLLYMLEEGSAADAKLYIKGQTEGGYCASTGIAYMTCPLYIETRIIITNSALDTSADNLAKGSLTFTVDGPIKPRAEFLIT